MAVEPCRSHSICLPECSVCQTHLLNHITEKIKDIKRVRAAVRQFDKLGAIVGLETHNKRVIMQATLLSLISTSVHLQFCVGDRFLSTENLVLANKICKGNWFAGESTRRESFLMNYIPKVKKK